MKGLDPDSDPALFFSGFQEANKNVNRFFCLFLTLCRLRIHKTVEIQVFLIFSCLLIEGSGSEQTITDTDPGGPKTYGSGRKRVKETSIHSIYCLI